MKRNELLKFLGNTFDLTVADYAFNGLQVEGSLQIKKIALAVSASLESINDAVKKNADVLIVHHGIFWYKKPVCKIDGILAKKLELLIKNNVNLIAIHLPLDGHIKYGHAAILAKKLRMKNILPFGKYQGTTLGVKGTVKKMAVKTLASSLKNILNHEIVVTSNNTVSKIGIVTGAGGFCIESGFSEGLDAVITGEITEKDWYNAREHNISLLAAGHHATERLGMIKLKEILGKNSFFIDSDNPV